jgi:hypothetical protein
MATDDIHTLDNYLAFHPIDEKHFAFFAFASLGAAAIPAYHLNEIVLQDVHDYNPLGWCLNNFRSQRHDTHEFVLAQLASDGAKYAGPSRFALIVDQNNSVIIKADMRSIGTPRCTAYTNHDTPSDIAFFDSATWNRFFNCNDNLVADRRIPCARSAENFDTHRALRTGIVGHYETCLLLNHGERAFLPGAFHNAHQTPVFHLAERPGFHDFHGIAQMRVILLVVNVELLRSANDAAIQRVFHKTVYDNNDRLIALFTHYSPNTCFTMGTNFNCHDVVPSA